MMWWGGGAGWGSWSVMILAMVAFWALVVIAIGALLRGVHDDPPDCRRRPQQQDALRVLDERLARGDLDVQDYRARRALLKKLR